MQMFGVGIMEMMVILILAVLVVGPDRLPAVAADLAKFISRTRAYATHLTRDFNDVISEIEKESGATREDWKEVANVIGLRTGQVGKELEKVAADIEKSAALDDDLNVVRMDSTARSEIEKQNAGEAPSDDDTVAASEAEAEPGEEKPWYVPERPTRRRPAE
jgi:sec-independent protein translocase protein TatB